MTLWAGNICPFGTSNKLKSNEDSGTAKLAILGSTAKDLTDFDFCKDDFDLVSDFMESEDLHERRFGIDGHMFKSTKFPCESAKNP